MRGPNLWQSKCWYREQLYWPLSHITATQGWPQGRSGWESLALLGTQDLLDCQLLWFTQTSNTSFKHSGIALNLLNNADYSLPGRMVWGKNLHSQGLGNDRHHSGQVAVVSTKDVWVVAFNKICPELGKSETIFVL